MVLSKYELGQLVKEARKIKSKKTEKKYTQVMLARDINRSQGHIGDVESGRCYPTFRVLNLIADACEVPLSFFNNTEIDIIKKVIINSFPTLPKEEILEFSNYVISELISDKSHPFVAEDTAYFISINRPEIIDAKYAMYLILSQPELMLNGEIISAESKSSLANAIQLGLSCVEQIQKKDK